MCFHCAMNCVSSEEVDNISFVVMQLIPLCHCFDTYDYLAYITTFHLTTFNVGTSQSWPIQKVTRDTPTWLTILFQKISLFEKEDLLSYCIDGPKILGNVLLYKISLENHPWSVKVLPYLECMKGFVFDN